MPPTNAKDLLARRRATVAGNAASGKTTRPSVPPARPVKSTPVEDPTTVTPLKPKRRPVQEEEIIETTAIVVDDDEEEEDDDLEGDDTDDEEDEDEDDEPAPPVKAAKKGTDFKKLKDKSAPTATAVAKIVKPASRSLALPMATPRNKQMTNRDRIIPRLALSQSMSKVAKEGIVPAGNWYHTVTQADLGDQILFVPVDWNKSRSMFVRGQGVVCRSFDLIKGEGKPGILCEGTDEEIAMDAEDERGCPHRLWTEGEGDRRIPPKCGEAHNYFGLILDNADPANGPVKKVLLTLRSTATATAKAINSIVSDSDDEDGEIVWHNNVILLSVSAVSRNGNDFFTPRAEFYGYTEGAALTKAENFASQLSGMNLRTSLEARDDE